MGSSHQIEKQLCQRLERVRLDQNISQSVLAEEAGVSRRTISRMENGEGVSLDTFVRVARALGLIEQLQSLFQLPEIRPVDRVRGQAPRKNASSSRSKTKDTEAPWEWDD